MFNIFLVDGLLLSNGMPSTQGLKAAPNISIVIVEQKKINDIDTIFQTLNQATSAQAQ